MISAFMQKTWIPPMVLFVISGAAVLSAFMFEHIGGLAPCELCWYQRYAHFVVLALTLAALLYSGRSGVTPLLIAAAGIALLISTGIAGYHVGVERSWFESSCAIPITGTTIEEIRAALLAAPTVRCDEVAWSMWGISMAGWNGLLSLALALAALYSAFKMERNT